MSYEIHKIKGWRSRMEDNATTLRNDVYAAPSRVVYLPGIEPVSNDQLQGCTRWFNRLFGPERAAASLALRELNRERFRLLKSELPKLSEEEIEAKRAKWRQIYYTRRQRETAKQRLKRIEQMRATRAMRTPEKIELQRQKHRDFRARQTDEWRSKQTAAKKKRVLANPSIYKAIEKRTREHTRDARNERRRAQYKSNRAKGIQPKRSLSTKLHPHLLVEPNT